MNELYIIELDGFIFISDENEPIDEFVDDTILFDGQNCLTCTNVIDTVTVKPVTEGKPKPSTLETKFNLKGKLKFIIPGLILLAVAAYYIYNRYIKSN